MISRTFIAGAGQAGIQTAISLRQGGYNGEVILAGKEPHIPYQRPPLSKQVLKKEWAAERCQLRHLEFYEQHNIDLLLGVSAVGLDTRSNTVRLDDGTEWQYSSLAICTGSRLNRLNIPGSELFGIHYLRTIDDALSLSSRLQTGTRVAVIGGGYIGLEVAAAARELGCEVHVIEALGQVMQRSALPEIAGLLFKRHVDAGVTFLMNCKVSSFAGENAVESVVLENGELIPADVVMVGVGVRPDLRWLESSEIETNRGIRVDAACRSSVGNVYAAGDIAELRHHLLDGWHVLESVQNAVSQGKVVAASILDKPDCYTDVPWFWSEQYDCKLQMAGIPRDGDLHVHRSNPDTGGLSIFSMSGKRLNAVQSINSPRDYMVGRQLITQQAEVDTEHLHDSEFNLKELL